MRRGATCYASVTHATTPVASRGGIRSRTVDLVTHTTCVNSRKAESADTFKWWYTFVPLRLVIVRAKGRDRRQMLDISN